MNANGLTPVVVIVKFRTLSSKKHPTRFPVTETKKSLQRVKNYNGMTLFNNIMRNGKALGQCL